MSWHVSQLISTLNSLYFPLVPSSRHKQILVVQVDPLRKGVKNNTLRPWVGILHYLEVFPWAGILHYLEVFLLPSNIIYHTPKHPSPSMFWTTPQRIRTSFEHTPLTQRTTPFFSTWAHSKALKPNPLNLDQCSVCPPWPSWAYECTSKP